MICMKSHRLYAIPDLYERIFSWDPAIEGKYLLSIYKRFTGKMPVILMDVGCGTGRVSGFLEKTGFEVFSFDISSEMVGYSRARRGLDAVVADARRIPVRSGIVDLSFSLLSTLNHFSDDADFLDHFREVYRVLRRNGIYITDMVVERPPCRGECESWEVDLSGEECVFRYIVEESSVRYYIDVFEVSCGEKKVYESRMRMFLPESSFIRKIAGDAGFNDVLFFKPFSFERCSAGRCFIVFKK